MPEETRSSIADEDRARLESGPICNEIPDNL